MSLIAVTGGHGFIGNYVRAELYARGYDVLVIDHSNSDSEDVRSPDVRQMVSHCDGVIHLAGVLGTEELFDDAEAAVDTNINGTINVLKACASRAPSIAYVGITMPQVWDNVYQATKLAAMKMASAWHRHFNVPVAHVRAFNVFGPGQKVGSPQKIIPTFAHRAWAGKPLPVWGDGTQLVDLIYVEDVARILVDALKFHDNRIIDAGTGRGIPVNEVANLVNQVTAMPYDNVDYLPMRKGEHGQGVVAEGEGWELLEYKPEFDQMKLVKTIESYRDS